jgi:L-threonylcarbamoyladenylate synthase
VLDGYARDAVASAAAALRAGLIVAIPTDTVYGLAASIHSPAAVDRLYSLKGRPREKAIPILLSDVADMKAVAREFPPCAVLLARRFWPGALTLVVPALPDLPEGVTALQTAGERTVGVRVPDHPLARAIIAAMGGALAVTSANPSGAAPALEARDAGELQGEGPDLVIDGGRAAGGTPSTVVDVSTGVIRVLREGAISQQAINALLGTPQQSQPADETGAAPMADVVAMAPRQDAATETSRS